MKKRKILTIVVIINFLASIGFVILEINFAEYKCVGGNLGGYFSASRCNVPNVNDCYCKLFGSEFLYDITGPWFQLGLIVFVGYFLYLGVSYIAYLVKKIKASK